MTKPNKTYKLIYADPPWHYDNNAYQARAKGARTNVNPDQTGIYPTMPHKEMINEIAPLMSDLADPVGCIMLMWITNRHFPEAVELAKAAGFEWVNIAFVWDKDSPRFGRYTNFQYEFVALFKKGRPVVSLGNVKDTKISQKIVSKRRQHSRKPELVRTQINKLWPDVSKIELFAREKSPGWDVWGNEVDKFTPDLFSKAIDKGEW